MKLHYDGSVKRKRLSQGEEFTLFLAGEMSIIKRAVEGSEVAFLGRTDGITGHYLTL